MKRLQNIYIIVDDANMGHAQASDLVGARKIAKNTGGRVKLFADWKGPNKSEFIDVINSS